MIEFNNLDYKYNKGSMNEVYATKNLSGIIEDNKLVSIIGRSGSGKSTLLYILGSFLKPQFGKVVIDNTDIYSLKDKKRSEFINKNIGFIFQNFFLENSFNAIDNVIMPLLCRNIKYNEAKQLGMKYLELVGLSDRAEHFPNQLSGGEMQRVCIARAMVGGAKYIFADEPTGNLDIKSSYNILNLLQKLVKEENKTVIMITHNREDSKVADRRYELEDGTLKIL